MEEKQTESNRSWPRLKQRLTALLEEVKKRRIVKKMFIYLIGAVGVLASVYELTTDVRIERSAWFVCLAGAFIFLIFSWRHGEESKKTVSMTEVLTISLICLTGLILVVRAMLVPTQITILIRMMEENQDWFVENIIRPFERENRVQVVIREFEPEAEVVETLKRQAEVKRSRRISLVKTPLEVTLVLIKEGLVRSFEDVLEKDLGLSKPEVDSRLEEIEAAYDEKALAKCSFDGITGKELFYLPRKLETRLMVYRKSKVEEARENWRRFEMPINDLARRENGYGLPRGYTLEGDVNEWDYYDVLVVSYYWANTEYDGRRGPRTAHRSKDYSGTSRGLIDRALQLGADQQDIIDMYRFSDGIIDLFHWEAVFRKYDLYSRGMWEDDGWTGGGIYRGMKSGDVFLAWMHQLDCLLIHGSEELGIEGFLEDPEDLGTAVMPLGISFELTWDGLPQRTGTRRAHTYGWFWGIPENAPEPQLAYKLALFITGYEPHLSECENFFLIPARQDIHQALKIDLKDSWRGDIYEKSREQFRINKGFFVPRFKGLDEYQKFLDNYNEAFEEIVWKRRYSPEGPGGRVDRDFIREHLR